jgi:hypothetical protein
MPTLTSPSVGCIVPSCAVLCCPVPACAVQRPIVQCCLVPDCPPLRWLTGWLAGWLVGCLCSGILHHPTPPTTTRASRSQPAGSRPEMTPRDPALAAVPSRYAGRASSWERRRDRGAAAVQACCLPAVGALRRGRRIWASVTVKQRLKHGRRDSGECLFCASETRQPPATARPAAGCDKLGTGPGRCCLA